MRTLFTDAFHQPGFRSEPLTNIQHYVKTAVDSKYTIWLLVGLGILRTLIFVLAYPPAHGADSADYFLYAAQFEGLDAPVIFQLIYPLYPLMIYISHYVLGSIYILIIIQLAMSAVQGALFYWGIRPYNALLAFMTALLVIFDAQTGILFSFISTEPLYMFLLTLAFSLFLVQTRRPARPRIQKGDIALGTVLALTLLARPVGRYLIVPFGVLFLLGTWSIWRTAIMVIAYGIVLALSILFNQIVFDQLELTGGGNFMLNRPLVMSGLLEAENGPASARLIDLNEQCATSESNRRTCQIEVMGTWNAVTNLYADAYQEMLQTRGVQFFELVIDDFNRFLRISGQQYRSSTLPSDVQCTDVASIAAHDTQNYLDREAFMFNTNTVDESTLYPIVYDMKTAMCPPWPHNSKILEWVNDLQFRYRSLSRPHPYNWYISLGLMALLIPWARRTYFVMVLLAGGILANHAAISAMVLNVQPRYVAVVNPYKGILLLLWFFIVGQFMLRLVDEWIVRRQQSSSVPSLEETE